MRFAGLIAARQVPGLPAMSTWKLTMTRSPRARAARMAPTSAAWSPTVYRNCRRTPEKEVDQSARVVAAGNAQVADAAELP